MNAFYRRLKIQQRALVSAARQANQTAVQLRRMKAPKYFVEQAKKLRDSNFAQAKSIGMTIFFEDLAELRGDRS